MRTLKPNNLLWVFKTMMLSLVIIAALFCSTSYAIEEVIQAGSANSTHHSSVRLTPKEQAWLQQNPNIRVAVKSAWMPIEFKLESERHRGVSVDYLSAISKLLKSILRLLIFLKVQSRAGSICYQA